MWDKNKSLFETLVIPIILYGFEVWGCNVSRESRRKIEQIQKQFITYKLKIKSDTPYPIILKEVALSPIERIYMMSQTYKITPPPKKNQHTLLLE